MKRLDVLAVFCLSLVSVPAAPTTPVKTECVGYHTVSVPGGIEYPLLIPQPENEQSLLVAGHSIFRVNLGHRKIDRDFGEVTIYPSKTQAALEEYARIANDKQQKIIDGLEDRKKRLSRNSELDPDGFWQNETAKEIESVPRYHLYPSVNAVGIVTKNVLSFQSAHDKQVVDANQLLDGRTPEQAIAEYLGHFVPRGTFEIPKGPGACLPSYLVERELEPGYFKHAFRLTNLPDIAITIEQVTAFDNAPDDPDKHLGKFWYPSQGYSLTPLDRIRPIRSFKANGRKGYGVFALITRQTSWDHPPYTSEQDWGYAAVLPGDPKAPEGTSFTVSIKVERFGRFAKSPMTEAEFRKLALDITTSIKYRPGSWKAP